MPPMSKITCVPVPKRHALMTRPPTDVPTINVSGRVVGASCGGVTTIANGLATSVGGRLVGGSVPSSRGDVRAVGAARVTATKGNVAVLVPRGVSLGNGVALGVAMLCGVSVG